LLNSIELGLRDALGIGLPDANHFRFDRTLAVIGWSQFFSVFFDQRDRGRLREGSTTELLKELWATAEQKGDDFGLRVADEAAIPRTRAEREVIGYFISQGNQYRSALSFHRPVYLPPIGLWSPDPRYDERAVYAAERFAEESVLYYCQGIRRHLPGC
jgi:hypothetical protein